MDENADACDNDADLRLNLKSRLRQARDSIKPSATQWHYTARFDLPQDEAESDWVSQCHRHEIAVCELIDIWIRTGKLDVPNDQARFFLAIRIDAAHELVSAITFVKNFEWTTIF